MFIYNIVLEAFEDHRQLSKKMEIHIGAAGCWLLAAAAAVMIINFQFFLPMAVQDESSEFHGRGWPAAAAEIWKAGTSGVVSTAVLLAGAQ